MSGDRELLELSAKAAGIRGAFQSALSSVFWDMSDDEHHVSWNPISDDGDALRLAVKLDMDINAYPNTGEVAAVQHRKTEIYHRCFERVKDDKAAAVRRAIVRCAAEIGKARA